MARQRAGAATLAPTAETQATLDRRRQNQTNKDRFSAKPGMGGSVTKLDDVLSKDENGDTGLNHSQNQKIAELQSAWDAANQKGDYAGMNAAHKEAERIRASAGLTGGADGALLKELPRQQKSVLNGGYTVDDIRQGVGAYKAANSDGSTYNNGYSPDMNNRSLANYIRQQMKANSDAWVTADAEGKAYLHNQNLELAKVLSDAVGGVQSTYNEALGRWETDNPNLGYGYYTGGWNDRQWAKDMYGMTDEQIDAYKNDTNRYYNFVDQSTIRNWIDEGSGFTGRYAQFVNGPYGQWLAASATGRPNIATHQDVIGDGVGRGEDGNLYVAPRDAQGNIVPQAPYLKGGNVDDYTRSKAAYIENGVIMPGILNGTTSKNAHLNMWLNGGNPVENPGENYGITWGTAPTAHTRMGGSATKLSDLGYGSGAGVKSYEDMINEMYDAQMQDQLAQLSREYDMAIAELDAQKMSQQGDYTAQRLAAAGEAERQAAAFREMANAQGLSSGAMGQNAMTSSGQAQANLATLGAAQAQATADIEAQRAIIAQSYQRQIQQAEAENDYARVQALYEEAKRVDEALRAIQLQNSQYDLAHTQMIMGV